MKRTDPIWLARMARLEHWITGLTEELDHDG